MAIIIRSPDGGNYHMSAHIRGAARGPDPWGAREIVSRTRGPRGTDWMGNQEGYYGTCAITKSRMEGLELTVVALRVIITFSVSRPMAVCRPRAHLLKEKLSPRRKTLIYHRKCAR